MRNLLKRCLGGAVLVLLTAASTLAIAQAGEAGARQLWQLIDYVAVDYAGAVAHGAVVSPTEYAEMLDFTAHAASQIAALPAHPGKAAVVAAIADLRAAVIAKAEVATVKQLARHANALLMSAYPIAVAPKALPDLVRGAMLYRAQCASCHGVTGAGDGALAASLEPKPIAFTDPARAQSRSLMALFQVVSQGVGGTSMPSFAALTEDERWDLAFYVGGLSHDAAMRARGAVLYENDARAKTYFPDLAAITTMTEEALATRNGAASARDLTAFVRSQPARVAPRQSGGLALARSRLSESLAALHAGNRSGALQLALSAYLDGFEPIEPMVGARNKSLLTAVESRMLAFRAAISGGRTTEADSLAAELRQLFLQVDAELGEAKADPMTTFAGALTILLREGMEALLIVIGIIAFLKKSGRADLLAWVHAGWAGALGAGVLTWMAATYLITISGASREVSEGVGSVLAALVLLSVGLWMHQKSSAGRWQQYLNEKLSAAMTRRTAWSLFALAFVAVYREVFETVLFYSALAADGNQNALFGGFATAVLLLAAIAWLMLRTSARMPIGRFFSLTSALVAVLAVVLMGKGVAALQEAGWIDVAPVAFVRIDVLGILPTVQTLSAQVAMLLVVLAGFGMNWLVASGRR